MIDAHFRGFQTYSERYSNSAEERPRHTSILRGFLAPISILILINKDPCRVAYPMVDAKEGTGMKPPDEPAPTPKPPQEIPMPVDPETDPPQPENPQPLDPATPPFSPEVPDPPNAPEDPMPNPFDENG